MLNRDNVTAALYGFAIGDAMGATTEFMKPQDIRYRYGKVDEIRGGGWLNLERGKVTDDTEMMLCVAEAFVKYPYVHNDFMNECCKNFVSWYKSGPVDIGSACSHAIKENIDETSFVSWVKTARVSSRLGNGSLMRCLVPALAGNIVYACAQGKLTHNNATCNNAIYLYSCLLYGMYHDIPTPRVNAQPKGDAMNTFYSCYNNIMKTDNFYDAVVRAVNRGGDADTIAALTGAVAGFKYGFSAIPKSWIDDLDDHIKVRICDIEPDLFRIMGI